MKRYRVTLGVFAVIFNVHEEILLIEHSYGKLGWSMPGGGVNHPYIKHMHSWNRMIDEIRREAEEETGLDKNDILLCPLTLTTLSPDCNDHRTIFIGKKINNGSMAIPNDGEAKKVGWFPTGNLPETLYFPQGIYIAEAVKFWHIIKRQNNLFI